MPHIGRTRQNISNLLIQGAPYSPPLFDELYFYLTTTSASETCRVIKIPLNVLQKRIFFTRGTLLVAAIGTSFQMGWLEEAVIIKGVRVKFWGRNDWHVFPFALSFLKRRWARGKPTFCRTTEKSYEKTKKNHRLVSFSSSDRTICLKTSVNRRVNF